MPRDPKRIEPIIAKLRQLWLTNPDLRFGQLVDAIKTRHSPPQASLFNMEDDQWEFALKQAVKNGL